MSTTPTTPAHLVVRTTLPGGQQAALVWVAVQHLLFLFLLPFYRAGLNPSLLPLLLWQAALQTISSFLITTVHSSA